MLAAPPLFVEEAPKPKSEMKFKYDKIEIFEIEQKYNLKISYNVEILFFEIEEKDR